MATNLIIQTFYWYIIYPTHVIKTLSQIHSLFWLLSTISNLQSLMYNLKNVAPKPPLNNQFIS